MMIKSQEDLMLMFLNAYANRENSTKAKRIGRKKNERLARAADEVVCFYARLYHDNRLSVVRICFGGKSIPPG